MTTKQYLQLVEEIKNYVLELDCDYQRDDLEVIQVWYCKTIQNHKGLFIVKNNITNSIYPYFFECTYNGDARELYIDVYTKIFKHTIKC